MDLKVKRHLYTAAYYDANKDQFLTASWQRAKEVNLFVAYFLRNKVVNHVLNRSQTIAAHARLRQLIPYFAPNFPSLKM